MKITVGNNNAGWADARFVSNNLPVASVVIAAHNEEAVIGRCLDALTATATEGEFDIVVVANGCTDRTAAVAGEAGARVLVIPEPGKHAAVDLGDRHCRTFPRLYLDADVEVDTETVRALVKVLADGEALAAAPEADYDTTGAGPVAARFHRVMDTLVGPRRILAGTGAYMLSEAAHARVFPMPDVIADDGLVHRSFVGAERVRVPGTRVVVRPARSVRALLHRRVRVRAGNRQLDQLGLPSTEPPLRLGQLRSVRPLDAACFLAVLTAERVLDRWRALVARDTTWSADPTTRRADRPTR